MNLRVSAEGASSGTSLAELASEKNQVMDALLDRPQVPSDYGDVMIGLYRDKSQDVLTRAFAVQHIGLYARDLSRRGEYAPDSAWDADGYELRLSPEPSGTDPAFPLDISRFPSIPSVYATFAGRNNRGQQLYSK